LKGREDEEGESELSPRLPHSGATEGIAGSDRAVPPVP